MWWKKRPTQWDHPLTWRMLKKILITSPKWTHFHSLPPTTNQDLIAAITPPRNVTFETVNLKFPDLHSRANLHDKESCNFLSPKNQDLAWNNPFFSFANNLLYHVYKSLPFLYSSWERLLFTSWDVAYFMNCWIKPSRFQIYLAEFCFLTAFVFVCLLVHWHICQGLEKRLALDFHIKDICTNKYT